MLERRDRRYFDFTFPGRGQTRLRIVERPGRWLDDAAMAALVDDVRAVVRAAVPEGSLDYGVAGGDRTALERVVLTLVYCRRSGRPVGLSALAILDCEWRGRPIEVLHLGLVLVHPEHRGRRMSRLLYAYSVFLMCARRQLRPLWISNVTQVPAVIGLVAEGFTDVYPTPGGDGRRSFDHLHLARQIMARHRGVFGVGPDAEFDERRFVIRNAYTGGSDNLRKSFEEAAAHRDARVNAWCRRTLDYDRGDDVLQIGRFTVGAARRNFARLADHVSPRYILLQAALIGVEALVAPIAQWLRVDEPMGELRARTKGP